MRALQSKDSPHSVPLYCNATPPHCDPQSALAESAPLSFVCHSCWLTAIHSVDGKHCFSSTLNCRAQATLSLSLCCSCSLTTIHNVDGKHCFSSPLNYRANATLLLSLCCSCSLTTIHSVDGKCSHWDSAHRHCTGTVYAVRVQCTIRSRQQAAASEEVQACVCPKRWQVATTDLQIHTYAHTNALMHSVSVWVCVCVFASVCMS